MGHEFDIRTQSSSGTRSIDSSDFDLRASNLSDELHGRHRVRIARLDPETGRPAAIASDNAPLQKGNYVQRALEHLNNIHSVRGFAPSQPAEYSADPHVQRTSSGAASVHLQQRFKSVPIFQAAETVSFHPNGAIRESTGNAVQINEDKLVEPTVTAAEAVVLAAEYLAVPDKTEAPEVDQFGQPLVQAPVDLTQFKPTLIAKLDESPDHVSIFEPGPFGGKITVALVWFDIHGDLRLGWQTEIVMPRQEGQYRTIIDAHSGEVLYCKQLMHMAAAQGRVFQKDGEELREMVPFPRPLTDYGIPVPESLPDGFPDDWVSDNRMVGNSVSAGLLDDGPTFSGATDVDGVVIFDPADPTGEEQQVLNIFYYNCYMHDYFYLLGFTEADGNFQESTLGRSGLGSDSVNARAHPMAIFGTANMRTPPDGLNPTMNMGLVESTGRHTAFDSSVVFHEFSHGVTNRLVGGRMNATALDEPQSGGMGEGWGDYFACTINNTTTVGSWVVNNPRGIRRFAYDADFPDNFGMLGTGRYTSVHNLGEIWCATLMEMTRETGLGMAAQLIVDALKLSPANPSFLDMRDAILDALTDMATVGKITAVEYDQTKTGIWTAFARFGMGPGAACHGAKLTGIVADFQVPPTSVPEEIFVAASPNLIIPDNDQAGIAHQVQVQENQLIAGLVASIDIEHTFIGDLRVSLEGPDGQVAVLHNRSGGSANDLVAIYSTNNTNSLSVFIGTSALGEWTLRVSDLAGVDVGRLLHWSLKIEPSPAIA